MNYHIFIKSVRNRPGVITLMGVLLSVSIAASLYAVDDDVKKMIRRATGITDEDVKTASGKKDITLFDAFALAVHKTERMAIEGENAIQAEERKLQAIESFLPYVSLRANKAFPEPDTRYVNLARSAVSLYLRQPIVTGLKEASQIKAKVGRRTLGR